MKTQTIHNSLALVYRALAAADPACIYKMRIYCEIYTNGYEDLIMKFVDEEWCMWDRDNEEWWPVSHWTFDDYDNVELLRKSFRDPSEW